MNKNEVLNLAKLARIEIGDNEAESLSREFESILNYVGEVRSATGTASLVREDLVQNIMRPDKEAHKPNLYTEKLLGQAPAREGNYFKVKKIL